MEAQTFAFFGIVGSGKGTQIKLLQEYLKSKDGREVVYSYPGNEYRRLMEENTETGVLVKESMNRGELQPDFLTNAIFVNFLINDLSPEKHLIADGYPRTLDQSATFERAMKFYQRDEVKIIFIELSHDEAMKRNLARGRQDDTKEGIERRIQEYLKNVVPSLDYFDGKPGYTMYKVNGEQSIEKVHEDIIKALGI